MGHGFHYTDVETALAYLRASIKVQRRYPGFLLAQEIENSPLRHGRYFITKDSKPGKDVILNTYEQIKADYARLVAEDPANEVFGHPDHFFRILDPSEYKNDVNMDIVELGVETNEHLFLWNNFAQEMRQRIESHPNIHFMEHTNVEAITHSQSGRERFQVSLTHQDGTQQDLQTSFIVNSTWENIERLNAQLGITMPPGARTNRLKTLLVVKLPESLRNKNSMFFCMGQHGMMSNMGNGTAMMTFAKVTNMETSTGLTLSDNAQRLLRDGPTPEETQYYGKQMIEGISHYIPEMINAEILELKFGIVQTQGELKLEQLNDANHIFNKRSDHNIRSEELGLLSNPCMKLFYFVDNGERVSELIEPQIKATEVIDKILLRYQQKAVEQQLPFDPLIERKVRKTLEKRPLSELTEKNLDLVTDQLISKKQYKNTMLKFGLFKDESTRPDNIATPPPRPGK